MPALRDLLPDAAQLACAIRVQTPARLAAMFAAYEGQFYDRQPFDSLARQVHQLYPPADAEMFRSRLDRRLCDRHAAPIRWDPSTSEGASA